MEESIHGNTKCEECGQIAGRHNRRGVKVDQYTGSLMCKACRDRNRGLLYFRVWLFSPEEKFPSGQRTVRLIRGHDSLHAAIKATAWARRYDKGALIYDFKEGLRA